MTITADTVHHFWFGDFIGEKVDTARQKFWFVASEAFDLEIRENFESSLQDAWEGKLSSWQATPRSSLALVLLLDQFSRNIYRGESRAFDFDSQARTVAKQSIDNGFDLKLTLLERAFFYFPLEHSELLSDQEQSVLLFERLNEQAAGGPYEEKTQGFLRYAYEHKEIIERFSRFPHRNKVLNRPSTEAEEAFLSEDKRRFGQ